MKIPSNFSIFYQVDAKKNKSDEDSIDKRYTTFKLSLQQMSTFRRTIRFSSRTNKFFF